MNTESLSNAVEAAKRFLKAAEAVKGEPGYPSKENGAVKRASMDLNRNEETRMTTRETFLNDAVRELLSNVDYDQHFATHAARIDMETRLWLTRYDALVKHYDKQVTPYPNAVEAAAIASKTYHVVSGELEIIGDKIVSGDLSAARIVPRQFDPIPMILFCHNCGVQHIDAPEPHKPNCDSRTDVRRQAPCNCDRWTNPVHSSHLCSVCGLVFRPADVPTTGVAEIATRGQHDSDRISGRIAALTRGVQR